MSLSTAEFAWIDKLPPDELYRAAKDMKALQESPGWVFLTRILGASQQRTVDLMVGSLHEQAKYADLAGFIRALKLAYDAPQAVQEIAERAVRREQEAAEQAAERQA